MIKLKSLLVEEDKIESSPSNSTFQMYHGGKRWTRIPTEIQSSKNGRYEAGVGIYFTNSYNTARRYGKGSRVVHLVELDRNFKNLNDVEIPTSDVVSFLKSLRGLKHRTDIINDIVSNATRRNIDHTNADTLNNLIVNYESGAGDVGIKIANYFVSRGADASIDIRHGGEFWVVVVNPNIIKKVSVINPASITSDFPFMLPTIK